MAICSQQRSLLSKQTMAANANPDLSTMATNSAAPSEEELPVVELSEVAVGVIMKWESEETTATHSTVYADPPYSFFAVNANQKEPFIKTFGSLLHCDGGFLTIGGKRYIIQVKRQQQQQQQQNGELRCCCRIVVFIDVFEYGNASLFLY